jgi:hypothetical protein
MFKKEPAIIIGFLIVVLQALLQFFTGESVPATPGTVEGIVGEQATGTVMVSPGWLPYVISFIPLLQAILTRFNVFSPKTLEDANLVPAKVEETARVNRESGRV